MPIIELPPTKSGILELHDRLNNRIYGTIENGYGGGAFTIQMQLKTPASSISSFLNITNDNGSVYTSNFWEYTFRSNKGNSSGHMRWNWWDDPLTESWQTMTMVFDTTGTKMYFDKSEKVSGGAISFATELRFNVGLPGHGPSLSNHGGEHHGEFNYIAVWNKALSSSEIAAFIDAAPTEKTMDVITFYNFGEDGGSTFIDSTSNGNDGSHTSGKKIERRYEPIIENQVFGDEDAQTTVNVLSLNDPDFGSEIAVVPSEINTSVSLLATNGTITITTLDGITITDGDNDSTSMTLSGNYEDVNAALLGFTFTPEPDFYGLETILVTAEDGVTKNLEINILGQNDPVELSYPGKGEGTSGSVDADPSVSQSGSSIQLGESDMFDMPDGSKVMVFKYNANADNGQGQTEYTIDFPTDVNADVLIVGGGGGASKPYSAGGGGGGVIYATEKSIASGTYTIKVGSGGLGATSTGYGENGVDSEAFNAIATGGGGGGILPSTSYDGQGAWFQHPGKDGGSGGGAPYNSTKHGASIFPADNINSMLYATDTTYQEYGGVGNNAGGNHSAGGGGASADTSTTADGSDGIQINIDGNNYYWGGGGGGYSESSTEGSGNGGQGGGGGGSGTGGGASDGLGGTGGINTGETAPDSSNGNGGNGGLHTGGGGGGTQLGNGGNGGSGIIIIRYTPTVDATPGPTVDIDGDGFSDTAEDNAGSNKLDANSMPGFSEDTSNLVAWYKLDGDLKDSSNNNDIITTSNGIDFHSNPAKYGQSTLIENNEWAKIDTLQAVDALRQKTWTVSFWVNFNEVSGLKYIVGGWDHAASNGQRGGFHISLDPSNRIRFSRLINHTFNDFYHSETISNNTWYHVVVVVNEKDHKIIVNTVIESETKSYDLSTPHNDYSNGFGIGTAFRWGGSADYDQFDGYLDDIRIYNKALTADEVAQLYAPDTDGDGISDAQEVIDGTDPRDHASH